MTKRYIITLMAANRVGILSAVTTGLAELGANLMEVSQTVLNGFFTIILDAEFPGHRSPDVIVAHLKDFCRPYGVEIDLKDPEEEELQNMTEGDFERFFLTVTGNDEPGMIRQISARISQEGIDISDLYAKRQPDTSFVMVMELSVPLGIDVLVLKNDLEAVCIKEGLTVTLQHENIFAATNDPRPIRLLPVKAVHDLYAE
ncbi:hypothetical protein Pla110_40180 [Polystyrenella longa]|uniref:ACT domain-containing protein n=1 Tax=Polystyrenella longa TaxID=2528007 RepID=A0A518CSQ5_9PLAN|nr:ACT domain-containing protein [Polystyrenella longa]QDU82263.1 hypothetical protein Pla110_40180 [Polystyrenella longa]